MNWVIAPYLVVWHALILTGVLVLIEACPQLVLEGSESPASLVCISQLGPTPSTVGPILAPIDCGLSVVKDTVTIAKLCIQIVLMGRYIIHIPIQCAIHCIFVSTCMQVIMFIFLLFILLLYVLLIIVEVAVLIISTNFLLLDIFIVRAHLL